MLEWGYSVAGEELSALAIEQLFAGLGVALVLDCCVVYGFLR